MSLLCKNLLRSLLLAILLRSAVPAYGQSQLQNQWEYCKRALVSVAASGEHERRNLKLLSGANSRYGYYYKVAGSIASVLKNQENLDVENVESPQTECNLWALGNGLTDFAFVQSDVAHDAWYGHPPMDEIVPKEIKVSLLSPLFVEAVHILIRPHLNFAHLADLRGRRVWLGPRHSLTVYTAKSILDAAGLTGVEVDDLEKSTHVDLTAAEAFTLLMQNKLDAVFQVGAYPYESVRRYLVPPLKGSCDHVRKYRLENPREDSEIHLFDLNPNDIDLVQRLAKDGRYIEQLIPADVYCQDKAALTVGVRALLLTNRKPDDDVVGRFAWSVFRNRKKIENAIDNQLANVSMSPVKEGEHRLSLLNVATPPWLKVQYHSKAMRFNPWTNLEQVGLAALFAGGFILLAAVLYLYRHKIGPGIVHREDFAVLVVGLLALLLLWVATSAWLWQVEGNVNEEYSSVPRAMISTLQDSVPGADGPLTPRGQSDWTLGFRIGIFIGGATLLPLLHKRLPNLKARLEKRLLGLGRNKSATATRTL